MKGATGSVKTVVLVLGLGHAGFSRVSSHGFLVGNDGVSSDDLALGEIFFKIVEADFNVEFTASGNDVFTAFVVLAQDEGIGLGQFLKTFDELGQISGVLGLDSHSHDGGDGVFHATNRVSFGVVATGDGTGLDQVLIDTRKGNSVTARNIGNRLDGSSHHEDGSGDILFIEIVLLSGLVVGSHNADTLSGADSTGEDTAESVEAALIGGRHHL